MREACRKLTRRAALIGSLAALSLVFGCAESAGDQAPNLLLITIDTARADRIGCYGSADAATPSLDRIAAEGALFETAIAVAPIALPSHVSLLTGQYPPRHGVRLDGDFLRPGAGTTLAEHLASNGYTTAAVVGSYALSADFGLARGFGVYDEPSEDRTATPAGDALRHYAIVERPAADVTDAALQLLDGKLDAPFFLWLHYYDPHGEYAPPEPFASRFAESPYDGELAYVDAQLGRLFDALRSGDRLDHTLVAVTSDHGESLGEHREAMHGLFVYDATVRVPLLLRFPAEVPAGTRSGHLVAGVDLAPTLLDLLGQPPMTGIDGVSFAAAARGETLPPREPAYSEAELPLRAYGWAALHALHGGDRKFIDAPQRELYDLTLDPGETRNLANAAEEEVEEWARRLAALEADWPSARPEAERADRPDPKRLVLLHNLMLDAQRLMAQGALPQAQELLGKALKSDPANPTALAMSGTLSCSTGDCELGVKLLESAAHLAPHRYLTQRNLGNALHLAGRYPEAAEAYRAAVALHPLSAEDHYALGNVLFAMGEVDDAIASYDEAARLGLDAPPFHAALGVARAAAGDAEGAREELQRAVDADPGLADAWNQLGILSEKAGRLEEARGSYGRALEVRPDHANALFNDAKVCLRLGRVDAAEADVARLLAARPNHPAGRFLEAQVRLAQGDEAAARRALEQLFASDDVDPRLVAAARELEQRLGN